MTIPIDEVHRLIDLAEEARRSIDRLPTDSVQIIQLPELSEVIIEISGWEDPDRLASILLINSSVLNKFMKMRGVIRKNLASKVADRLRSYLKTEDQKSVPAKKQNKPIPPAAKPEPFKFEGESWVAIDLSSDVKMKINIVSTMLDSIVEHVKHSNVAPEDQALTEIERKQLIAILETALAVLKGPLVEKGLLKKARSVLENAAINATEKGVQDGLAQTMGIAKNRISELIAYIFS